MLCTGWQSSSSIRLGLNCVVVALDVRLDAGHVLLLGFRPELQWQSSGTFKVLFNPVVYLLGAV